MSPLPLRALPPALLAAVTLLVWSASAATRAETPGTAPTGDEKATKDDYELDTTATDTRLKLHGEGQFSLVITPKNGKKIHPDAPLEVTFKPSQGVKPQKGKLGRADIADKAAKAPQLKTVLRGEKAGTTTLEADVSFFLCTDAWCQRMSDRLSLPLTVEPSP